MNHCLLPDPSGAERATASFGTHAMEVLINGLIRAGAHRDGLVAELLGGARVVQGLSAIGVQNAAKASPPNR